MERLLAEGYSNGWLKDTAGLMPPKDGARIRSKGGKLSVIDGPFSETKEMIGGYAIIEAESRDAAIEIALRVIELRRNHDPGFEYESEVLLTSDS